MKPHRASFTVPLFIKNGAVNLFAKAVLINALSKNKIQWINGNKGLWMKAYF